MTAQCNKAFNGESIGHPGGTEDSNSSFRGKREWEFLSWIWKEGQKIWSEASYYS